MAYTDDGKTLSYTDDSDGDGISDATDNCPFVANRDQLDTDGDGIGDACDNCPSVPNPDQSDINGNGIGDLCDPDMDGDGIPNEMDNCPKVPNKDQLISFPNLFTIGDACNPDIDGDGVPNAKDNCPLWPNPDQSLAAIPATNPATGKAVVCTTDQDGDGVPDQWDNCPTVANPDQSDINNNGIGDACDPDMDGDHILNGKDNCPKVFNPDQKDSDNDGVGDACQTTPFCYVVDKTNPDKCLDPNSPFKILAGADVTGQKGVAIRLPLWANRNNAGINYKWTVTTRPNGSSESVANPVGSVSLSRNWEYAYIDGQVPTFEADVDGDYTFQVSATLAFPDRQYPNSTSDVATFVAHISGGTAPKRGCSSVPGDFGVMALFGVTSLLARRKRK